MADLYVIGKHAPVYFKAKKSERMHLDHRMGKRSVVLQVCAENYGSIPVFGRKKQYLRRLPFDLTTEIYCLVVHLP